MPLSTGALLLTLGASAAFGGLDATRKKLGDVLGPLPLTALLGLGQVPVFIGWCLLAGASLPRAGYVPQALASIAFNLTGNLLFLRAVQLSPLSLTIPFLSFSPVFSALFSTVLLGELPGPLQLFGMLWVVAGAFLLNLSREDLARPARLWRVLGRERGSLLMLGTALVWALGSIFDKRALVFSSAPMHGLVLALGIPLGVLLLMAGRGELARLGDVRRAPRLFSLTLLFAVASVGLQLLALPHVFVSLYEAIKRCVGMTLAVVNGALLFGEPVTVRKLVAIALMGTGVVCILS
jgi:drug/metabolite transporter (DMT)-like permease